MDRLAVGIFIIMLAAAMAFTAVGCQKAGGTDSGKYAEKAISAEQLSVSPANVGSAATVKINLPGYKATAITELPIVTLNIDGASTGVCEVVTGADDVEITLDTSNVKVGDFKGNDWSAVAVNFILSQENRIAGYAVAAFWSLDGKYLDNAVVLKAVLFDNAKSSKSNVTRAEVEQLLDEVYFKYVRKLGISCMTDDEVEKLLQYEAEYKGVVVTADPKCFAGCKNLRDFELDERVVFLKDYDIYVTAAMEDSDVPQYVLEVVNNVLNNHRYYEVYGFAGNQYFFDLIVAATKAQYGITD